MLMNQHAALTRLGLCLGMGSLTLGTLPGLLTGTLLGLHACTMLGLLLGAGRLAATFQFYLSLGQRSALSRIGPLRRADCSGCCTR